MTQWLYDRDSRTVFDAKSGTAVCIVSDLAEHDVMHDIGRLLAGAFDLRKAGIAVVMWASTQPDYDAWPARHPVRELLRALMATIDCEVRS